MILRFEFALIFRASSRAISTAAIIAAILYPASTIAQSTATGVPNAVQGFSQNRDKPIQIDAASLEMRDKDKAATFSGNVKVVQGDTTMLCKTLVVFYDNSADPSAKKAMKSATPGPGGSSAISRLEAKGGVRVTQKDQIVTGDRGIFDMKSNTVTMDGNVVLTKDKNILRGDRLVVDMTTGVSRVEGNKGVSGMFTQSPGAPSPLGGKSGSDSPPNAPGKPLKLN